MIARPAPIFSWDAETTQQTFVKNVLVVQGMVWVAGQNMEVADWCW